MNEVEKKYSFTQSSTHEQGDVEHNYLVVHREVAPGQVTVESEHLALVKVNLCSFIVPKCYILRHPINSMKSGIQNINK